MCSDSRIILYSDDIESTKIRKTHLCILSSAGMLAYEVSGTALKSEHKPFSTGGQIGDYQKQVESWRKRCYYRHIE